MKLAKKVWNNEDLRCGEFYELAIEVSLGEEIESIKELTKKIFEIEFVNGPFNENFEVTPLDIEYFNNLGYIEIENKEIPFCTFGIMENGNNGSNWLCICVYSGIYDELIIKRDELRNNPMPLCMAT